MGTAQFDQTGKNATSSLSWSWTTKLAGCTIFAIRNSLGAITTVENSDGKLPRNLKKAPLLWLPYSRPEPPDVASLYEELKLFLRKYLWLGDEHFYDVGLVIQNEAIDEVFVFL